MSASDYQLPHPNEGPSTVTRALRARGWLRVSLLRNAHEETVTKLTHKMQHRAEAAMRAGDLAEKALLRNGRKATDLRREDWAEILEECFTPFEARVHQGLIGDTHRCFLAIVRLARKRDRIERELKAAAERRFLDRKPSLIVGDRRRCMTKSIKTQPTEVAVMVQHCTAIGKGKVHVWTSRSRRTI